jgi:L-cysteine/cystine lyase
VTPEEARGLFPVLERLAYLNAGTFGPLATPTVEAVRGEIERDLRDGRLGKEYFERLLELRRAARAALAGLVGAEQEHDALTVSTTDGCNIVVAGL